MSSLFKTKNSVNTIIGVSNDLSSKMSLPIFPRPATTLNTKRNVLAGTLPPTGVKPAVAYFGIGIKGFYNVTDSTLSTPYEPSEENLDIFQPVPVRVVKNDTAGKALIATTNGQGTGFKDMYRLRTLEIFGGEEYWCFYLKKLTLTSTEVDIVREDLATNIRTPYIFDASNLNPVPVKTSGIDTEQTATSKVIASVSALATITGEELAEAINIIYGGDFRLARISEVGYYSGFDADVTTPADGGPVYKEAAYVQLSTHRCFLGSDLSDPSSIFEERVHFENGSQFLI